MTEFVVALYRGAAYYHSWMPGQQDLRALVLQRLRVGLRAICANDAVYAQTLSALPSFDAPPLFAADDLPR